MIIHQKKERKLFVAPALCAGPVAGTAIRHGGRAPWLQKRERKIFVAPALCAGPVAGTAIRHGGRAPWLQKKERKHNPHCRPTLCGRRSPAGDRAPAYSSKDL